MKTIFGSRKYHYVTRVCIFLITLALVVEMVGCSCGGGGGGGVVKYDLNISSTAGGNVTTPGEGKYTYAAGKSVNLVAKPASGYQFVNWTGNVSTIGSVTAASTTITMNGAYSITANFVAVVYDLNISTTAGGSVTPGVGKHTYNASTVVNLLATPDAGYSFVNWTGNVSTIVNPNAASTTIIMNGHYSITANFVALYDLTIYSTAGGSVTKPPGVGKYTGIPANTGVVLEATPDDGYSFVNWTGNVSTIVNPNAASTTIIMKGNYTITANFEKIPRYYLTISSYEYYEFYEEGEYWEGGYVLEPGERTFYYYEGEVVNLVAVSTDPWCQFARWMGAFGTDTSTIDDVWSPITTITMKDNYVIAAFFVWYIPY